MEPDNQLSTCCDRSDNDLGRKKHTRGERPEPEHSVRVRVNRQPPLSASRPKKKKMVTAPSGEPTQANPHRRTPRAQPPQADGKRTPLRRSAREGARSAHDHRNRNDVADCDLASIWDLGDCDADSPRHERQANPHRAKQTGGRAERARPPQ